MEVKLKFNDIYLNTLGCRYCLKNCDLAGVEVLLTYTWRHIYMEAHIHGGNYRFQPCALCVVERILKSHDI